MTMEQSLPLPLRPEIPEDAELASADERAWRELLARLSRQSVTKHFDAYERRRLGRSRLRGRPRRTRASS